MQFASGRVHFPAEIGTVASPVETRDTVSAALARLQKHVGQFACEVDVLDPAGWQRFADEFAELPDEKIAASPRAPRDGKTSFLLLRRLGKPVAGARVSVITFPGSRRGLALLSCGPFWRLRGEQADFTVYRATVGALVQQYCILGGHRLAIRPNAETEFGAKEAKALKDFGFVPTAAGEYHYWSQPSARITGSAVHGMRRVQRTIRRWRKAS